MTGKQWRTLGVITLVLLAIAVLAFVIYKYLYNGKLKGAMCLSSEAAKHVKKFEGYTASAIWDVNAWRIGHGSDTITLDNGTYRKVVQGDLTTPQNAERDLARRIEKEFIPKIKNKIGEDTFEKWGEPAQIAFISFAYNYGNITKKSIVDAAQTFDKKTLADAWISSTINDNQSLPLSMRDALKRRRAEEAQMILDS